jgi:hypothetical protein
MKRFMGLRGMGSGDRTLCRNVPVSLGRILCVIFDELQSNLKEVIELCLEENSITEDMPGL